MGEPWHDSPDNYITDWRGKRIGLNWDNIKTTYLKNCSPDEMASQIRKMKLLPAVQPKPANAVPERTIVLMVDYYVVGNKIDWIAKELGIGAATVRKYLVDRKVYEPGRDSTRKAKS